MICHWKHAGTAVLAAVVAAMTGCASPPDAALERVTGRLAAAQANTDLRRAAAGPLADAGRSVEMANEADEPATRRHYIYIAGKNLDIADALADRVRAEQSISAHRKAGGEQAGGASAAGAKAGERALIREMERERLESAIQEAQQKSQQLEESVEALKQARVTPPAPVVLDVPDIHFAAGAATLSPGHKRRLDPLVLHLRDNPALGVVVEGYTDNTDGHAANLEMSAKRAAAVKAFLVESGIAENRVHTLGLGAQYPIADNKTPEGRRLNRRVEIVLAPDTGPAGGARDEKAQPAAQSGNRTP